MSDEAPAHQHQESEIQLLVGTDNALLRELMADRMSVTPGIGLIAASRLGGSFPRLSRNLRPDVTLLALKFGTTSTAEMDLVKTFIDENPGVRLILLSSGFRPGQIALLSQCGVAGFLLESQGWKTLVQTVESVHAGSFFITPSLARSVLGINLIRRQLLTLPEAELMELVSQGLSNNEIAAHLNVSESTVRSRLSNVLLKLNASNRTQAVTVAIRKGYVSVDF